MSFVLNMSVLQGVPAARTPQPPSRVPTEVEAGIIRANAKQAAEDAKPWPALTLVRPQDQVVLPSATDVRWGQTGAVLSQGGYGTNQVGRSRGGSGGRGERRS